MADLFGSPQMAAGYATWRPPVHPKIVDRIRDHLGLTEPVNRALDVGCGAGLSTKPLQQIARQCLGLEPVAAMTPWAVKTAPEAAFLVGRAEDLPLQSRSVDIITAAGSLNYTDLDRFFPEASRVLVKGGVLVVYDFSAGRRFRNSPALDTWYGEFLNRYPSPSNSGQPISPDSLASRRDQIRLTSHELFEVGLSLSPGFYLNYVLTETNVADAVQSGVILEEVKTWCARTLAPVFNGEDREVLFRGYIAYMS
jgi:SAM-dependent methyltransferase